MHTDGVRVIEGIKILAESKECNPGTKKQTWQTDIHKKNWKGNNKNNIYKATNVDNSLKSGSMNQMLLQGKRLFNEKAQNKTIEIDKQK